MQNDPSLKTTRTPCPACKGEPEPEWIEMPNNGPIVPCHLCNRERGLADQRDTVHLTASEQRVMARALRRCCCIIDGNAS